MKITIETKVAAPLEKVWDAWVTPSDITKWNFASQEWICPRAEIDLRQGQTFNYRMEAKDGTMGFDFEGAFTEIIKHEKIEYMLEDERKVVIGFVDTGDGVLLTETFEAESEHSGEQQRQGWQSILNNFKKYVEGKGD